MYSHFWSDLKSTTFDRLLRHPMAAAEYHLDTSEEPARYLDGTFSRSARRDQEMSGTRPSPGVGRWDFGRRLSKRERETRVKKGYQRSVKEGIGPAVRTSRSSPAMVIDCAGVSTKETKGHYALSAGERAAVV